MLFSFFFNDNLECVLAFIAGRLFNLKKKKTQIGRLNKWKSHAKSN